MKKDLRAVLGSMVEQHGFETVSRVLHEITADPTPTPSAGSKTRAHRRRPRPTGGEQPKQRRRSAGDYVQGMKAPEERTLTIRRAAEEFERRAFLPTLGDVRVFCGVYGIEEPRSRADGIPRIFQFLATMDVAEVEKILDDRVYSGPAQLGPIAAAIRNKAREHRVRQQRLIEYPKTSLPSHVVLLGAGASRAAFPQGDASSRRIPLMNDLVATLGLEPAIRRFGILGSEDFEAIYCRLADRHHDAIREDIERRVEIYFSSLSLPEEVTLYDRILLSLRPEDAIFTFNWDPFLFDAYARNCGEVRLPKIFFLHGNVRIGRCPRHEEVRGRRHTACSKCGEALKGVPLLYPVENKEYSKDPYVSDSWDSARVFLKNALVMTVFGYSAPSSDVDAVELLKSAWLKKSRREMEHIEAIDIIPEADLCERWEEFAPTGHFHAKRDFHESWIAMWPRRSREGVFLAMSQGIPSAHFPLSGTKDLAELQAQVREIAKWETGSPEMR